jgi:hypothetical protein
MRHQLLHAEELDADIDDLAPMVEIEFEESDDVETAMEVGLLRSRLLTTQFSDY